MRERERARAGERAQVSLSEHRAAMRLPGGALARMRANGRHRLWQRPDEIVFDRRAALPWLQLPQNLDKHPVSCGGESASRWSQSTPAAACEQHTHGCRAAMSVPAPPPPPPPPPPPRFQTAGSGRRGRRENQCRGRAERRRRSTRWTRPPRSRAPPRSSRTTDPRHTAREVPAPGLRVAAPGRARPRVTDPAQCTGRGEHGQGRS